MHVSGSTTRTSNSSKVVVFLLLVFVLFSKPVDSQDKSVHFSGELIVQLFQDSDKDLISEDFQSFNLRPKRLLSKRLNIWLYEFDPVAAKSIGDEALLTSVSKHNEVAAAQFNYEVTLRQKFPDDTFFSLQWGLYNTGLSGGVADADIDAPEAWDITTGGTTIHGDEIVIAVIDNGFQRDHPDLDFWINHGEIPDNGIDDDSNGYVDDYQGFDAHAPNDSMPVRRHGTHVSGICAAKGNNGQGVSGVNWNVKVLPITALEGGLENVVQAYGYVLEMRARYNETNGAEGAFIVATNSSFGIDFADPELHPIWCSMYDAMGAVGIISAVATSNRHVNIDAVGGVPSSCGSDYMLAVTNISRTDTIYPIAAYGAISIDLGAPGTNIYSTITDSKYAYATGTSMASPHVAGAIALMFSNACSGFLHAYNNEPAKFALDVRQAILDGVDPNVSLDGITVTGGRLNIFNSLNEMAKLRCKTTITHSPLENTRDTINPYEILCEITADSSLPSDEQLLHYNLNNVWYIDTLIPTGQPDEFQAFVPPQSPSTIIDYYMSAVDAGGLADTTEIFTFIVTDYELTISPSLDSISSVVDDTVWFQLTITNSGLFTDKYILTTYQSSWNSTIWDANDILVINSTPEVLKDSSFSFQISVIIPNSSFGDAETTIIKVASTESPGVFETAALVTNSYGIALTIPFLDRFTTTTLDTTKWIKNVSADINSMGLNMPSPPYALNLNGYPTGADTIVSRPINLEGKSPIRIRYYYQQTGGGESPDAGDNLYIQFLDASGRWNYPKSYAGSGPDMNEFAQISYVPFERGYYHKSFRIRIFTTGTFAQPGRHDDWFVDNIYIGPSFVCGDVNDDGIFEAIIELTYLVDYIFRSGPAPPLIYNADFDGNGEFEGILELTYLVDFIFRSGPAPVCPN